MKKKVLLFILFGLLIVTGCTNKEKDLEKTIISNGSKIETKNMIHDHCTRNGRIDNGDISLQYELYYTGEVLNLLQSEEKVISADTTILDTYENAYKQIHAHYQDLTYYDAEVIRGDTTVTSQITINYDKIDIQKLLAIEGEEDNIIENGVAKVAKWKELAKKFGTTCETIEDTV